MTLLRQLLLLPLLTPLLTVVVIGAINPGPALRLRLLTWETPPLGLGAWLILAAGGGGLLSALGTGLALRSEQPIDLRRRLRRPAWEVDDRWRRDDPPPPSSWPEGPVAAGPARDPGEPSPTVAVPYRVIRRHAGPATVADGWDQPESDAW